MVRYKQSIKIIVPLFVIVLAMSSFLREQNHESPVFPPLKTSFPYKKAGLTERQAAAHLLSRFTYGAQPGQGDAAVKMGLKKWLTEQLTAGLPDDTLNQLLAGYDALTLTNEQVVNIYPKNGQVIRMA